MECLKKIPVKPIVTVAVMLTPLAAHAGVPDMIANLQTAIFHLLAPIMCIGGVVFAGIKLAMGDESAKRMLFWSCVGTVIAFTAPSIINYLRDNVAG